MVRLSVGSTFCVATGAVEIGFLIDSDSLINMIVSKRHI